MANASAKYEITAIDKTKAAFNSVKRGFKDVASAGLNAAKSIGGIAAGLGAVGAVGSGVAFAGALKSAAGLHQLSKQSGESVRNLDLLQRSLKRVGMEDELPDLLSDLQERLQEAKVEPDSTPAQALERMGIDPSQFERGGLQLAQELAAGFNKTKDLFSLREFLGDEGARAIQEISQDIGTKGRGSTALLDTSQAEGATSILKEIGFIVSDVQANFRNMLLNPQVLESVLLVLKGVDILRLRLGQLAIPETIVGAISEIANRFGEAVVESNGLIDFAQNFAGKFVDVDSVFSSMASTFTEVRDVGIQIAEVFSEIVEVAKVVAGTIGQAKENLGQLGSNIGVSVADTQARVQSASVRDTAETANGLSSGPVGVMVRLLTQMLSASVETARNTAEGSVAVAG